MSFQTIWQETYDQMPPYIKRYYDWMGKMWKAVKPYLPTLFWYTLTLFAFYNIHKKYGFEIALLALGVSLLFKIPTRR